MKKMTACPAFPTFLQIPVFVVSLLLCLQTGAQESVVVAAGPQYHRSAFHQWLWGKHYRQEWIQPVKLPVLHLHAFSEGMHAYEAGGGQQSRTLRLRDARKREYVLRSVDKDFGRGLPEAYQQTFIDRVMKDQVSTGHPYAALTIPPMAEAAGIYHTNPVIGFVPRQPALNQFSDEFGNTVYLFEQRPDEDWSDAANFGNSKRIIGTDDLLEDRLAGDILQIDQLSFVRARLFDMFVGDWGRHEDQWRWALIQTDRGTVFRPIPRDRDQTYTLFDGVLLSIAKSGAGFGHLQSFGHTIRDVKTYNYPARHLDRQMANATTLQQWLDIAADLQARLTDTIINEGIRQMPPEVYPLSGPSIADKLLSRRDDLLSYAKEYYAFLAKEVEVVGTTSGDFFDIHQDGAQTTVNVYKITDPNSTTGSPYYTRTFTSTETKEIRLFGLSGRDTYSLKGVSDGAIKMRIIGGPEVDSVIDNSQGSRLHIYDNYGNEIQKWDRTRLHLTADTSVNKYKYDGFRYDKKGFRPDIFFSNFDRFYIGLGYEIKKQKWRKDPYAHKHGVYARYSLSQKGFSGGYRGEVNQMLGNWNGAFELNYDAVRWTNFFGEGNFSKEEIDDRDFYRLRTVEWQASAGINHRFGLHHKIGFAALFQSVDIINDPDRFVASSILGQQAGLYDAKMFGGGRVEYSFLHVNNTILPKRGFNFGASATYLQNTKDRDRSLVRYNALVDAFIPLFWKFGLALRNGGGTVSGDPEFYQLVSIGGSQTLRGYRRDRFWGRTAFFNSNELQWITDFKGGFSGSFGFVAFYDQGRVWNKKLSEAGEWHSGYGGGIIASPLNKISFSLTYGMSKETKLVHLRFLRDL